MSVKYYIAKVEVSNVSNESEIFVKDEISEEYFRTICNSISFLKNIEAPKEAHKILTRNGEELLFFLSEDNVKKTILVNKTNKDDFITEANRLTFNFCASMRTFVDYTLIAANRKGEAEYKDLEDLTHNIFDELPEYRFFEKLRNYIIHYSYPFGTLRKIAPDRVEFFCMKKHLLEYDAWGAIVKKDMESMPEEIDIRPYIRKVFPSLESIYLMMYYYYAEDYCKANNLIANLEKKYDLRCPAIIIADKKKTVNQLPIRKIVEGIELLKHHPFVDINFN